MKLTIRMKDSSALEFDRVDSVDAENSNYVTITTEEDEEFYLIPWMNVIQITFEPDEIEGE
jgi:hypothetical protein